MTEPWISPSYRPVLLLLAAVLAGCAATTPRITPPTPVAPAQDAADLGYSIVRQVPQGGLLLGRVPKGGHLRYDDKDIRVGADGHFVIGVARTQTEPLKLSVDWPDGHHADVEVAVLKRTFPLERVDGVPEDTVNPPPAIAERIAREQAGVDAVRQRDDDRDDYDTRFIWPVQGRISGVFGSQRIYNGTPKSPHSGLDIAAAQGTAVQAPAGGIVTFANPDLYLTGGTVLIDHGHGVSSNFLHLSRIDVVVGERVEQGQVIGLVGKTGRATGPHMHWGMNWFGVRVDPQLLLDPAGNPQPAP